MEMVTRHSGARAQRANPESRGIDMRTFLDSRFAPAAKFTQAA